ncbi:MAG: monofunctional biosynthetic peptidoglycan transglycosylase [Spirochaetes bacterium]|nr:monofunctional biosynthetic peptidoglycan transglycosylase [Spirochaetota bacterium]
MKIKKKKFSLIKKINKFKQDIIKKFSKIDNKHIKKFGFLYVFFLFFSNLISSIFKFLVYIHILLIVIFFIICLYLKFFNPISTSLMIYRNLADKQNNQRVIFIPIRNISKLTQRKIVLIEDYRFYEHKGIDIEAIKYAYSLNKKLGYKYAGGSTITQQLARNLFLIPDKNYIRKYLEILISIEMELILDKKRILELYINYIEFGNGIYGIGRASQYYYEKSFYKLDNNEINKLIAIIPSPRKYTPWNFINNYQLFNRYWRLLTFSS